MERSCDYLCLPLSTPGYGKLGHRVRSCQFELFSVRSSLVYQQNGVYDETSSQTFRCGRGRRQHQLFGFTRVGRECPRIRNGSYRERWRWQEFPRWIWRRIPWSPLGGLGWLVSLGFHLRLRPFALLLLRWLLLRSAGRVLSARCGVQLAASGCLHFTIAGTSRGESTATGW